MEELNNWKHVIGVLIGGLATIVVAAITTGNKNKKEDQNECMKTLKELEETVDALKLSLREERKVRGIVEGNWEGMKLAFRVAFDEYEHNGADMGMLKTLRDIINK
tara:strand:- start:23795 stop:24112 length:318 start_codon:yes stop_codon:yes gene_type:complete